MSDEEVAGLLGLSPTSSQALRRSFLAPGICDGSLAFLKMLASLAGRGYAGPARRARRSSSCLLTSPPSSSTPSTTPYP